MSNHGSGTSGWSWLVSNEAALLAAIVAVVFIAAALDSNHSYFDTNEMGNIARNIARNTAILGMFSLGAAVVIIAGGIDLSSGSVIAFSASICTSVMLVLDSEAMLQLEPIRPTAITCGITAALLAGLVVGTLHAWLITAVRLPPFVATLATLVGLRSLGRALVEYITETFGNSKGAKIYVNDPFFAYLRDHVWLVVAVFLTLAVLTWIMLTRTVLGRHIYALGGNEQAARLSGIRTDRVKWFAYCFAAFTASLAGIFYVANESVASPVDQGRGQELNAIAAAVVGGCSLQGGVGTVTGTILGALFLQIIIDAVAKVIKTGADVYEGLIVGIVVVIAVTFSQFRQVQGAGQQLFSGALGYCIIPILAVLAGGIALMTAGTGSGVAVGIGALVLLALAKGWERLRSGGGSHPT